LGLIEKSIRIAARRGQCFGIIEGDVFSSPGDPGLFNERGLPDLPRAEEEQAGESFDEPLDAAFNSSLDHV
jgi:hypothetical protein